ncbi:MAG: 4Fe-4S dicluster domain-containing protein, partial [Candidatus Muiribacteriaceae bacterium]
MKEIVIISGKGGTGKTSITAALCALANNPVIADCDVDAADLDLLLGSDLKEEHSLVASKKAEIIQEKCSGCGVCGDVCEYSAVKTEDGKYSIDPFMCEGCAACVYFCPEKAISFGQEESGKYFISESKFGPFVHA